MFLQVSEDDSYPSDVSDNISMDNFSNGTENDRQNPGIVSDFINTFEMKNFMDRFDLCVSRLPGQGLRAVPA